MRSFPDVQDYLKETNQEDLLANPEYNFKFTQAVAKQQAKQHAQAADECEEGVVDLGEEAVPDSEEGVVDLGEEAAPDSEEGVVDLGEEAVPDSEEGVVDLGEEAAPDSEEVEVSSDDTIILQSDEDISHMDLADEQEGMFGSDEEEETEADPALDTDPLLEMQGTGPAANSDAAPHEHMNEGDAPCREIKEITDEKWNVNSISNSKSGNKTLCLNTLATSMSFP
ncbi:hypothetical protein ACOMHN_007276 [Nucella lapillus]